MSVRGRLKLAKIPALRQQQGGSRPPLVDPWKTGGRYHALPATLQSPAAAEPVDKSEWQPCHDCGEAIPVARDRQGWVRADGEVRRDDGLVVRPRLLETTSYVCPFCHATQAHEVDNYDFVKQRQCHVCEAALDKDWLCPGCGTPRGWVVVACPFCGSHQAVEAPHLVDSCDCFKLDCVRCERRFYSLCIC